MRMGEQNDPSACVVWICGPKNATVHEDLRGIWVTHKTLIAKPFEAGEAEHATLLYKVLDSNQNIQTKTYCETCARLHQLSRFESLSTSWLLFSTSFSLSICISFPINLPTITNPAIFLPSFLFNLCKLPNLFMNYLH